MKDATPLWNTKQTQIYKLDKHQKKKKTNCNLHQDSNVNLLNTLSKDQYLLDV